MTNYWYDRTIGNDAWSHDALYDHLLKNLDGHEFGKFLAQIGITRENSIKFLIDALTYVNDQNNQFST